MSYVIAELKPGEAGGFEARGAVRQLWKERGADGLPPFETIVAGPAETGKTWGCLQYLDALMWRFPGAQGVIGRKTYNSLPPSALKTFKRILGNDSPVRPFGGEKPEFFQYPNGSRVWVVGLDNPGKALSTERDFIYINQAEELLLADWETLLTRCTGRGSDLPYSRLFGDCNPGPPHHWIKKRSQEGTLRLLESRHEDNPTLYDADLHLTAQGRKSISALDRLSGVRKERLRFGRWVQAEGVVYDEWDPAIHVWDARPPWWKAVWMVESIDFGLTNPFVYGLFEVDGDGRMLLVRELYGTGRIVSDWALDIKQGPRRGVKVTVADHDAEDRMTLARCGIQTLPAYKDLGRGIQAVQERLRRDLSGKPRLAVLSSALVRVDGELLEKRQPTCTAEEFEVYAYPAGKDGKPIKEAPVDLYNHGMDMTRYAVAEVDRLRPRQRTMSKAGRGRPAA